MYTRFCRWKGVAGINLERDAEKTKEDEKRNRGESICNEDEMHENQLMCRISVISMFLSLIASDSLDCNVHTQIYVIRYF